MARKLWGKGGVPLNELVEQYTVGEDYKLDQRLVRYDILASVAHAMMFLNIKQLTRKEYKQIKECLLEIIDLDSQGRFVLTKKDEDAHTKIENYLTRKLGKTGEKIHTGRSRNDQVLAALRLYSKEKLLDVREEVIKFCNVLLEFSRKHEKTPMPGYTHTQRAMPSSVALWSSSFIESSLDSLVMLDAAYELNDQCPLGSASGYGVPLDINREFVSLLLGFRKVQNNVLYVQNSRGKIESAILSALSQIYIDLSIFANDLLLFTTKEFGFFSLPDEFCTGSSMMPNKKNYDVLELIRARSKKMQSYLNEASAIRASLISGYSRDLQETKGPLMKGFDLVLLALNVSSLVVSNLEVSEKRLIEACSDPALYATDRAYELVKKGVPFREAYKQVAKNLHRLEAGDPVSSIMARTHKGAPGNLGLGTLGNIILGQHAILDEDKKEFNNAMNNLYPKLYPVKG